MDNQPSTCVLAGLVSAPVTVPSWLERRQNLVAELSSELHAGFAAVADFHARDYLDSVERQDALAHRLLTHDAHMPDLPSDAGEKRHLAAAVRAMNAELTRLAGIQTALIELGSRSARCFQRVWALGAPSYSAPGKDL
ncbi:MAG: hypothetical protein ACRD0Y_08725 [Terriglobales bacterium]